MCSVNPQLSLDIIFPISNAHRRRMKDQTFLKKALFAVIKSENVAIAIRRLFQSETAIYKYITWKI